MITKSYYLKFLTCSDYFWFHKKKPEVFLVTKELNEFDFSFLYKGKRYKLTT